MPEPLHSAIYQGWLRHRRSRPVPHRFRYPLFMMYLDLAELDRVFAGSWTWSTRRPALARFDRRGHLGPPEQPLDTAVRAEVEARLGLTVEGPIRLLTHLRYFGYRFNPVSFYYCFDAADTHPVAVVAEINNTPWGEQHCYSLAWPDGGKARSGRFEFDKEFHVSPFMPMTQRYRWRFSRPGRELLVHMENRDGDGRVFDATLLLERRAITPSALRRVLWRHPLMTLEVIGAIHLEALGLWWKGVPVYAHPNRRRRDGALAGR